MIKFSIPIKTVNPLNGAQGRTRGAVFAKAARRKREREAARCCVLAALAERGYGSLGFWHARVKATATLTRISAGVLDSDAAPAALKSVRDGIADALGINDGSDAVIWKYEQKKCKRGAFGVEVTIE